MKSNLPIDEAIYEEGYNQAIKDLDNFDWQAFRREAAKDILAGFCASGNRVLADATTSLAIQFADELIRRLKEK